MGISFTVLANSFKVITISVTEMAVTVTEVAFALTEMTISVTEMAINFLEKCVIDTSVLNALIDSQSFTAGTLASPVYSFLTFLTVN